MRGAPRSAGWVARESDLGVRGWELGARGAGWVARGSELGLGARGAGSPGPEKSAGARCAARAPTQSRARHKESARERPGSGHTLTEIAGAR